MVVACDIDNVLNNQINYNVGIKNSLLTNSIFLISIWLFGISLIGLPIVLVLLIYKGFIFGFSVSSIIKVYGIKGIFGAFTYLFPGTILALITTILLCFYSTSFSIKLFRYLFLKENLNVIITFYEGEVLGILLPDKIEYKITKTEPAVKGNTTNNATKEATVETGLTIKVPLFIEEGENVIVSTNDGKYVSRA